MPAIMVATGDHPCRGHFLFPEASAIGLDLHDVIDDGSTSRYKSEIVKSYFC